MSSPTFTLDDLSNLTGIKDRTIRSYIQQGLLRGAEAQGRSAYYTTHHLNRLRAVRYWKDFEGRSLDDIRALLVSLSDTEVEEAANKFVEVKSQAGLVGGSSTAKSALDYLRSLSAAPTPPTPRGDQQRASRMQAGPSASSAPPSKPNATPVDQILSFFEQLNSGRSIPRRAKGEPWVVIRVTPDFEIHVRGVNSADQLAHLERIADHLRETLLGGFDHV